MRSAHANWTSPWQHLGSHRTPAPVRSSKPFGLELLGPFRLEGLDDHRSEDNRRMARVSKRSQGSWTLAS